VGAPVRSRIAFIDYFPPHYRRGLYEEIGRRMEADFYFFADERERWHNKALKAEHDGDYRRVDMWRTRVAGQAVMPGIALALSRRRYDAVVKSLNGKLMLPLTYIAAKWRGVPFVLWTGMWHHPTTPFHRRTRALTEAVYRNSAAIVAYGEHVKRFVCATPGVSPEKVFVAGQAVDGSRLERVQPSRAEPDVLFIGQFKQYKGVGCLLDAFDLLDGSGARLRLVGNGPLDCEIRRRTAHRSDVEVVGHVPQDRLPGELTRARCLVLPSVTTELDREPWGLVVNEAMHAGLPVVASSAVGAAAGGLVRDGRNGLVVPERDERALAVAIRRLVDDPSMAARLGEQARDDVRSFNYRRMAEAFEHAVDHARAVAEDCGRHVRCRRS
jgi:glycosyltransferase involved in cell wall biosynthesis